MPAKKDMHTLNTLRHNNINNYKQQEPLKSGSCCLYSDGFIVIR